ncbi:MAG TPA: DUF1343 domain-containing protein [Kiritimatiellia bacterium]|nr:DUF1343 domain-containing protein [Kiritimatiellia bacterium]HRZ12360.1 DUF1343 domain-containing protein [Kiritimatiellia bacterium]HSA17882.1 DUF1343 domain-containing protein [Kiritimatiellia bacterium]
MQPGIETLLIHHLDRLRGRRVGLVAHPASVDSNGAHSLQRMLDAGVNLVALFGPEHGFTGRGGAGEVIADGREPVSGLPIRSLYGDTRKPTPEMLCDLDAVVFDLHDLGARPYTYVSTLRYVMEAATDNGKAVIVADRPIPLPRVVDGPMLDPAFESFVGFVRTPVSYGMTPGETARFLREDLCLDLDLFVAPMRGFSRNAPSPTGRWIPPSPAIRSWACAAGFPATVFFEALPSLDHGRGTDQAFQVVGAPWLDALALADGLARHPLPGVRFEPCSYRAEGAALKGLEVRGIRLDITDPAAFRPVQSGVTLIAILQELYGPEALWDAPGARPEFFDKLMGTDAVRRALLDGAAPEAIAAGWPKRQIAFLETRQASLRYT